jgi:phosphoglycolate phosphatase
MHNDAVIFDIDGTLWDASRASAEGWNTGLAKLGINRKVSAEQARSVAGNTYDKCIDILLPELRIKYPELRKMLEGCEIEAVKSIGGEFYDGVIEGIRTLTSESKVFLVSNCQEWYLNLFFGFSCLKSVLTGFDCNGISGLPKNEMLARIKRDYFLHNPVYIGDLASDETAAKLAGIDFVHAAWGFGKPERKTKTVNSFVELVEYLMAKSD